MSHSSTALELVPKAVDAVTAAFRMGLHGASTAKRFATLQDLDKSWSTFLGDVSSDTATQLFEQSVSLSAFR